MKKKRTQICFYKTLIPFLRKFTRFHEIINIYIKYSHWNLNEIQNASDGKVGGDAILGQPRESSSWLWNDDNGVDDGVGNAGNGGNFEQSGGQEYGRIGQDVE